MRPSLVRDPIRYAEEHSRHTRARLHRQRSAYPRIRAVLRALEAAGVLADVESSWGIGVEVSYETDIDAQVNLFLRKEARDSALLRRLVQATGCDAIKAKAHDGETLNGEVTAERVRYRVHGYVPATCRVVEEEVLIPAQPERVERRSKIICTEIETP